MQEAVTRLGSRLPYREAQEELALLWRVDISAGSVRQITMRHGAVAAALVDEAVDQLERSAPKATAQPEQVVMCTDGAMVQVTTGEWREVKTVTLGEFVPHWDAKRGKVVTKTERLSYFSRVEPAEAFGRSALVEWHRRGGDNAKRVVAVNDGAVWIQSVVDYHCPQAIRVLDFAHAQAYVATIGRALFGPETEAFQQWYARMSRQLGQQPPQRTLGDLRLLQQQHPDHPEAAAMEGALRYLDRRLPMIDYPHFRRLQIPIGSGNVESGHKVVMQRRMKQAGMRWAEENLNPMLALRTALCNQTWTTCWQQIAARVRQQKYPAPFPPRPAVDPSSPTFVTEADCQRLSAAANKIRRQSKRRPWQNHNWIFLDRDASIHRN